MKERKEGSLGKTTKGRNPAATCDLRATMKEGKKAKNSLCLSVLPSGLLSLKQALPSLKEDEEDGIWKPGRKLHVHSPLVDHVPLDFRS